MLPARRNVGRRDGSPFRPASGKRGRAGKVRPATDQRAITRPQDGDGNGNARSDIGAYERRLIDIVPTDKADFDGDGDLWFTGQSGVVGKVAVKSGAVTLKEAPRGRGPYGICATPKGEVWWCSLAGSFIARIDRRSGATGAFGDGRGPGRTRPWEKPSDTTPGFKESAAWITRLAMCAEPRDGKLYIFMPPTQALASGFEPTGIVAVIFSVCGSSRVRPSNRHCVV